GARADLTPLSAFASRLALLRVLAEEAVEIDGRAARGEAGEGTVLDDSLAGMREAHPGGARHGPADADAPHSERREVRDRELVRPADEHVHGLRRDGLHDRGDLIA